MARSIRGWILVALAVLLYWLPDFLGPRGGGVIGAEPTLLDSPFGILFEFWWVLLLIAVVVLARDYGVTRQITVGRFADSPTGGLSIEREDIIQETNWARINRIVFRRSIGISLIGGGAIAVVSTALLGVAGSGTGGGLAVSAIAVVILLAGIVIYLFSRTKGKKIKHDYTHRVSVRIPDLFGPHSFHVHLRQIAEDLGFVIKEEVSPGKGGSTADFDEEIYLTKGGFVARKRPIAPPLSPFPDDSILSDLINLTAASTAAIMIGIAIPLTSPGGAGATAGGFFVVLGVVGLLYAYIARTRRWARLYCLIEGTVSVPTANLYTDEIDHVETHHVEPSITSTETSNELVVTVGIRASPFFEDADLEAEFDEFVENLETVASENYHRILEDTLSKNGDKNVTEQRIQ